MWLVARELYLDNKKAYKHTACGNLVHRHMCKFKTPPCPQAEQ